MEIAWYPPRAGVDFRAGLFRYVRFFVGWNEDGWTNWVWVVWLLGPTKEKQDCQAAQAKVDSKQ